MSEGREAEERVLDELIGASLAGDEQAFARLVEMKRTMVFRTAYQQVGCPEEARSVAQAVFVRLWKSLDRFDRSRRFDTWLYRLTVNAAIDRHRRRKARPVQSGFDETFDVHAVAAAPKDSSAEQSLELADVQRILAELTELLTERQRRAFLLREVEGLSTAETAEVLETSESTIRNHVFQARRVLRQALRERYPEYVQGTLGEVEPQ